jgi:LuxR family maltose regulon positive regulatory protein
MLHAARGEHPASLEELELADERMTLLEGEHLLAPQVSGWIVRAQTRLGRPDRARLVLTGLPPARAETGAVHVARALVELADGGAADALAQLHPVLDGTSRVTDPVTLVEAHLLAGLAHLGLGARREARAAAEAALAAAESDGVLLPFITADSLALLETVPPHDTSHRALLIEVEELLGGRRRSAVQHDWSVPPDPLSPSELRVLRYLPTNLTRPEIARELYVSVNTVNTHIRNIYAKLGARGRSAAVERARQLKLLSAGRAR